MSENVLGKLEPAEVFHYFEEISRIPRGSGNANKLLARMLNCHPNGVQSMSMDIEGLVECSLNLFLAGYAPTVAYP